MPYKISGTKSETGRIIIIKESDWSIESNTVISGSGAYSVEDLETGSKLAFSRASGGEIVGYGNISAIEYVSPPVSGDTGVFMSGDVGSVKNVMDYIVISTLADAVDFGDLSLEKSQCKATSNGVNDRGVLGGGYSLGFINVIEYITITSTADSTDFGDLTVVRSDHAAVSNNTNNRAVWAGGTTTGNSRVNTIDYVTISTPGNAIDFGDLTTCGGFNSAQWQHGGTSNGTNDRGVFVGGDDGNASNIIQYITISSTGNSTNFGDLTQTANGASATSNTTNNRAVVGVGGTTLDYFTISSTSDASSFGDLLTLNAVSVEATSNGTSNRGVFGGQYGKSKAVEYITITSLANALDFGDLTEDRTVATAISNA